jgi:hypothetical protein
MVEVDTETATVRELDAMIVRAEVACERYRRSAERKGLPPPWVARRRKRLQTMEDTLSRLRQKRAAAVH